jgi:hypothetical protein
MTQVYKLNDQLINLVTINTPTPSYSLEVYARPDYNYLPVNEQELKGRIDLIH